MLKGTKMRRCSIPGKSSEKDADADGSIPHFHKLPSDKALLPSLVCSRHFVKKYYPSEKAHLSKESVPSVFKECEQVTEIPFYYRGFSCYISTPTQNKGRKFCTDKYVDPLTDTIPVFHTLEITGSDQISGLEEEAAIVGRSVPDTSFDSCLNIGDPQTPSNSAVKRKLRNALSTVASKEISVQRLVDDDKGPEVSNPVYSIHSESIVKKHSKHVSEIHAVSSEGEEQSNVHSLNVDEPVEVIYKRLLADHGVVEEPSGHRIFHIVNRPFRCEVCGYGFLGQGNLANHRRVHTGQKPFQGETFGKRFKSSAKRILHSNRNGKEYRHSDEHSGRKEYSRSDKHSDRKEYRHSDEHSDIKEYRPSDEHSDSKEYCHSDEHSDSKEYRHSDEHSDSEEYRHSETLKFKCGGCQKIFSSSSARNGHMNKKQLKYSFCGKSFVTLCLHMQSCDHCLSVIHSKNHQRRGSEQPQSYLDGEEQLPLQSCRIMQGYPNSLPAFDENSDSSQDLEMLFGEEQADFVGLIEEKVDGGVCKRPLDSWDEMLDPIVSKPYLDWETTHKRRSDHKFQIEDKFSSETIVKHETLGFYLNYCDHDYCIPL